MALNVKLLFSLSGHNVFIGKNFISQMQEHHLTKGLIKNIAVKLIDENIERKNAILTYYNVENNLLFYIEKQQNKIIFKRIKTINVVNNKLIRGQIEQKVMINDPIFLRSLRNKKDIYINKNILSIYKENIPKFHTIDFKTLYLTDGVYTMFSESSGLIVDFYFEKGNILVTDLISPEFIKYGVPSINIQ